MLSRKVHCSAISQISRLHNETVRSVLAGAAFTGCRNGRDTLSGRSPVVALLLDGRSTRNQSLTALVAVRLLSMNIHHVCIRLFARPKAAMALVLRGLDCKYKWEEHCFLSIAVCPI